MMNMWLYSSKPRPDPLVQNEGASMHCSPYIEQIIPWSWSITASATCRALQPPAILAAAFVIVGVRTGEESLMRGAPTAAC